MDRAVVAVTVCMREASVIACVSSSGIILRTVEDTAPLTEGAAAIAA